MSGEDDTSGPKSALLAMLPKPRGGQPQGVKQKIAAAAAENGNGPQRQPAVSAAATFASLKPRQLPTKQYPPIAAARQQMKPQSSSSRAKLSDDSDDEEFEQRLGFISSTAGAHVLEEEERYGIELPPEGPAKPGSSSSKSKNAMDKPRILVDRPLLGIAYGSDSSDEEEEEDEDDSAVVKQALPVDFFGLSAKRPKLDEEGGTTSTIHGEPAIFIDEVAPGPARPPKPSVVASDESVAGPTTSTPVRSITDQQASKIIYERDLAPYGVSSKVADHAVTAMIDVNVDSALGPNVRQNLLRNLDNKKMAQVALGPLPKLKKSEADRLAKRKHQITHLATVAVSREEQLQEKWSESKLNKKMSRQKYGF